MNLYKALKSLISGKKPQQANKGAVTQGVPAPSAVVTNKSAQPVQHVSARAVPANETSAKVVPDHVYRMMLILLENDTGDKEYAYLLFDTSIEKEVVELFNQQKAIHPFAAVVLNGEGLPTNDEKEHMKSVYGFDTDAALADIMRAN